jgi:hypothetical protein
MNRQEAKTLTRTAGAAIDAFFLVSSHHSLTLENGTINDHRLFRPQDHGAKEPGTLSDPYRSQF